MKQLSHLVVSALVSLSAPSLAFAADVTVRLVGVEAGKGEARAALFASAASYDADDRLQGVAVAVSGDTVELVFSGVSPGTYGISAFQDLNGNAELDRSLIGMPKEPYGFSNNARGKFGPPKFEAFSFTVGDEPVSIEIELQ